MCFIFFVGYFCSAELLFPLHPSQKTALWWPYPHYVTRATYSHLILVTVLQNGGTFFPSMSVTYLSLNPLNVNQKHPWALLPTPINKLLFPFLILSFSFFHLLLSHNYILLTCLPAHLLMQIYDILHPCCLFQDLSLHLLCLSFITWLLHCFSFRPLYAVHLTFMS